MMKKLLIAVAIAGSLGTVTLPAASAVILVEKAPPAPRSERVPAARRGYIWDAGHWEWRRNQHVWVAGKWIRDRKGYVYNPPTWRERDGRWELQRSAWVRGNRDNDGDGVRNRDDARPNNPNRQ